MPDKHPYHLSIAWKFYALIVIVVICLSATTFHRPARATIPQVCPRISCPSSVRVGNSIQFTVNPGSTHPTYNWSVSAGTITSGAGGSRITVIDVGGGQSSEATVTMSGLPAGCPTTLRCETLVTNAISPRNFESYGRIARNEEKARLDNLAIELQNDPTTQVYIIVYGGRRGRAGEAQTRADFAKDYLVNSRGIDAARIVTVDGGFREEATTELWLVPAGAESPTPSPEIDASEVQTPRPPARRAPRRRGRRG